MSSYIKIWSALSEIKSLHMSKTRESVQMLNRVENLVLKDLHSILI